MNTEHLEKLTELVRDVVFNAWALCDDTEFILNGRSAVSRVNVPVESWDKLQKALENLSDDIPESDHPCNPAYAVTLIAAPDLLAQVQSLSRQLEEARGERDALKGALHDLVMLNAQDEMGCVTSAGWEEWQAAWREAEDLVRVEP